MRQMMIYNEIASHVLNFNLSIQEIILPFAPCLAAQGWRDNNKNLIYYIKGILSNGE